MRNESDRERRFWKPYRTLKTIALCLTGIAVISVFFAVYMTKIGAVGSNPAKDTDMTVNGTDTVKVPPTIEEGQMSQSDAAAERDRRANADIDEGVVIDCRTVIEATAGQTMIRNIDLTNSDKNTGTYMTYELRLPDSSGQGYEVLFTTGLIAPGNTVLDVELSRPFGTGEYNCVMVAQPYEISDLSQDNNLEMNVVLIVC